MSLIQEAKQAAGGKIPMPIIKTDTTGGKYYETLPPGTSVATIDSFKDHNGNYLLNIPYLIHSEITLNRYWANRTKPGLFSGENDFFTFLERGRVYVFKK